MSTVNVIRQRGFDLSDINMLGNGGFGDYANLAQRYLDLDRFSGTPLTGDILAEAAQRAYQETGVYVPVQLALAQAQQESEMGTRGRDPENIVNNPFNVGEWDSGTMLTFESTQEGVDAYYSLIARNYLSGTTPDQLLQNFVNHDGNRYASDPGYEQSLRIHIRTIESAWIDNNTPFRPYTAGLETSPVSGFEA